MTSRRIKRLRVAVVGAGWAGLAAAIELVGEGHEVVVLDAAPRPGGRARTLELDLAGVPVKVDNGQHLMIGAYRQTLALLERIGVSEAQVLHRLPMRLASTDGLRLEVAHLPAPLHLAWGLLRARGLSLGERLALMRTIRHLEALRWAPVGNASTVARWLVLTRQPASLVRRIWTPLCVAMMNTRVEEACAATFLRVLGDTLGASRRDVDFLLPVGTLGDVLPDPAARWLQSKGATLLLRSPCRAILREGDGRWRLRMTQASQASDASDVPDETLVVDRVVLAVPPSNLPRLLGALLPAPLAARFESFDYEPIATVWLAWKGPVSLPLVTMLAEDPARRAYGQWLFDRGVHRSPSGSVQVAGVVISTRIDAPSPELDELASAVAAQVASQLGCRTPDDARAIVEKRATYRCTPQRPRLGPWSLGEACAGISLAGDYAYPDYPATIESAVRSGLAAARRLMME
jgi:hydroxysqualene dehydroxylase